MDDDSPLLAFCSTSKIDTPFDAIFSMCWNACSTIAGASPSDGSSINITLGLPFLRISPDHGPNEKMLGKNKSNPLSLLKAISFLDKN